MASPQLEDGYTRMANELIEAFLLAKLTSRQWSVVMAIVRKTYGFNKKSDDIGLSQLAELTGLAKPHVSVTVRELEFRRIINRKQGSFGHILSINKHHGQWVGVTKSVTVTETVTVTDLDKGVTELVLSGVTESVTTKDNPTKDNQKKGPREEITFKKWLETCKQENRDPIPADDAVFAYADEMHIPLDFVRFAWVEFKRKYSMQTKRYKSWNQHFQNAVRENWYGIWCDRNGEWQLTTRGKQIQQEINLKAAA